MNFKNTNMNVHTKYMRYYVIMAVFNLLAVFSYVPATAQAPDFTWALGMGGTDADYGYGVSVDRNGNVLVAGLLGAAGGDFNPGGTGGALTSAGGNDIFLARYAPNGAFLWAKSMGGSGADVGRGVVTDTAGNVYLIAQFSASGADFNPGGAGGTLTSLGSNDVAIAKYAPDGTFLWAKAMGGTGNDNIQAVTIDHHGNVCVTGTVGNAGGDFNRGGAGGTVTSAGSNDAFVAKYNPNGMFLWAKSVGGTGGEFGHGIAVDGSDNVYITGNLPAAGGNFNPGGTGGGLTSVGGNDIFLAKYSAGGSFLWAKSMGGADGDYGYGVAVDGNDHVYVSGFIGNAGGDFNRGGTGGTLSSAGSNDVFIAKYDTGGAFLWAKAFGGSGIDQAAKIVVDGNNNVYATGHFLSPVADFNPGGTGGEIRLVLGIDAFVAGYDSAGNFLWAKNMGGGDADQGWGIAVKKSGDVYVTGQFGAAGADFNIGGSGGTLTSLGGLADAFVVRYGCSDTSSSSMVVEDCSGSFTLNGTVYTASGIYTQQMPNAGGCDSTITIDLTFYQIAPVITAHEQLLRVAGTYASYQWIKDGTPIPGATDSTLQIAENGAYRVTVTNEQGCEGTSMSYTVNNVSIEGRNGIGPIAIYPNPAGAMVYVNTPVAVNLTVTTLQGQPVKAKQDARSLDISDLASGMYLIHIADTRGMHIKTQKIVKEGK